MYTRLIPYWFFNDVQIERKTFPRILATNQWGTASNFRIIDFSILRRQIITKVCDWKKGLKVTVMLVASLCWWLNDGDHFKILMTKKVCWWHFSAFWWHSNRSPTSKYTNMRHQHRCNRSQSWTWMRNIFISKWCGCYHQNKFSVNNQIVVNFVYSNRFK